MSLNDQDEIFPFFKVTAEVQRAYQSCFDQSRPGVTTVLTDLARYCHAFAATDTQELVGRRNVWLHLARRRLLRDEELTALLAKLSPEQRRSLFEPNVPMYSPR